MKNKFFFVLLATVMVLSMGIAAIELNRLDLESEYSVWSLNGSTKDTCSGVTDSSEAIACSGELIYYGYTGFKTTVEAEEECQRMSTSVSVYIEDRQDWYPIDSTIEYGVSSTYAAGQYGNGTEPSSGSHSVRDYYGGSWSGSTSFSY